MAFDALQVKVLEGLISFTNTIDLRSTGASSTWCGRERENNLILQRWHFIPLVICKYITNYFKRNNFEVGGKTTLSWGKTTWLGAKQPVSNVWWFLYDEITLWSCYVLAPPGRVATFHCGESNRWPQFPVTLKTNVVQITCLMPINPRMSKNSSKRSVALAYLLQNKKQSREITWFEIRQFNHLATWK